MVSQPAALHLTHANASRTEKERSGGAFSPSVLVSVCGSLPVSLFLSLLFGYSSLLFPSIASLYPSILPPLPPITHCLPSLPLSIFCPPPLTLVPLLIPLPPSFSLSVVSQWSCWGAYAVAGRRGCQLGFQPCHNRGTHTHAHTLTHTHTQTHAHTHTHTHTHTHMQVYKHRKQMATYEICCVSVSHARARAHTHTHTCTAVDSKRKTWLKWPLVQYVCTDRHVHWKESHQGRKQCLSANCLTGRK